MRRVWGWYVLLNLLNDEEDEGQLYTRCEEWLSDLIGGPVETRYSFMLKTLQRCTSVETDPVYCWLLLFLTGFFHPHSPTAQISGKRHPPLTFCICLNHFPNFSLVFRLSSLSVFSGSLIFQTELMFQTPPTWWGLQSVCHVRGKHSLEWLKYM